MNDQTKHSDAPIDYMARTRAFYRALGYPRDYRWAENTETPFQKLDKPLSEMRLGIVITSFPPGAYSDENPPTKQVWSGNVADAPDGLYNQNLAWDKQSTHTRDRESYLPLVAMGKLVEEGVVGGLAERFHGVPTVYSQRETLEDDAPLIHERLVADHADAALLVPL